MMPSWAFLAVVLVLCRAIHGSVLCYECSSWTDPLCKDPFNFTLPQNKQPPAVRCDGCCVKLVQNLDTPFYSVRRTCTKKLRIDLFVVDRVCMLEGGGGGHMCFCEGDYCNSTPSPLSFRYSLGPLLPVAAIFPQNLLLLGRGLR